MVGSSWSGTIRPLAVRADRALGSRADAHGGRRLTYAITLVVAGALLSYARVPPATRNVLWAEDGREFYADALQPGGTDLSAAWAGYMHLVPRATSLFVAKVIPIDYAGLAMTISACIFLALIAAYVFDALRAHLPTVGIRGIVWLALVAAPVAGIEVNGSVANTHWYLLVGAFAAAVAPWSRPLDAILATVVLGLAIMSDPLALYAAPLVIVRTLGASQRLHAVPVTGSLASALLQLWVVSGTNIADPQRADGLTALVRATIYRTATVAVLGPAHATALYYRYAAVTLILGSLALVASVGLAFVAGNRRAVTVSAAGAAICLFAASAQFRWFPQLDPQVDAGWPGSRYSVAPSVLVVIAACLGVSACIARSRLRVVGVVAAIAVASCVVLTVWSGARVSARSSDSWADAVAVGREKCTSDVDLTEVGVPNQPSGWFVAVPCGVLTRQEP